VLGPWVRPLRRGGRAGQHPGGLASSPVRDILAGGRHVDGCPENAWGQPAQGLGPRTATDEQDPLDVDAGRHERIQAVGEPTEQALDGGPGQVRRLGGLQAQAVQCAGRGREVGGAFAFEIGHQD